MVAPAEAPERMFGKAIKRREDPRLITGAGAYLDDIRLPGLSHAALLRSPHGHARIRSIDTSRAAKSSGVYGVFTGEDFADLNPLPCAWQAGRVQNNVNTPRVLAIGKVTHVGDPVAVVVADDPKTAADALDLIEVDWEILPSVVDAKKATTDGAPQIHENAPNNVVLNWSCGKSADEVKSALDASEIRLTQSVVNQRLIPNSVETRGSIGRYDPGTGDYTLWATSQAPHVMRLLITAFVMGIPAETAGDFARHGRRFWLQDFSLFRHAACSGTG
jgi:carbon-monoxide dehydrogenase large subunit